MAGVSTTPPLEDVHYPESDGKPMAETPLHRDAMTFAIQDLRRWYRDDPNAYVSGNMFLYYVRGNPRKAVSPDVFVALGVPGDKQRRVYKVWEENGRGPSVVIEMTSASTKREDLKTKFKLYRDTLRVPEYFLYDPEVEYLGAPLRGYRLVDGEYKPIRPLDGRLPSEVLGLHLEVRGGELRFYDPVAGRPILRDDEALILSETARREADRRAQATVDALKTAEDELERLRREVEELRSRPPS